MINCCIRRQQLLQKQRGEEPSSLSADSNPAMKKKSFHGLFDEVQSRTPEAPNTAISGFNRFLERLVEGDDQPGIFAQSIRHSPTLVILKGSCSYPHECYHLVPVVPYAFFLYLSGS